MFHIFGFYKFKRLSGLKKLKKSFQEKLIKNNVKGTIIFSKEGINGTISGRKNNILTNYIVFNFLSPLNWQALTRCIFVFLE